MPSITRSTLRRAVVALAGATLFAVGLTACDATPDAIRGTVKHPSGSFAVGVPVEAHLADGAAPVAVTVTNGLGTYRFQESQLPAGTYRLRIGGTWWPDATSFATATPVVASTPGAAVADATIDEDATVAGRVVTPDRQPVPGVVVVARVDGAIQATGLTDADGRFTLGLHAPGDVELLLLPLVAPLTFVPVGGPDPITVPTAAGDGVEVGTIDVTTGLLLRDPTTIGAPATVATEGSDSCAVDEGEVRCWGYSTRIDLGDEMTEPTTTPTLIAGIDDAVGVAVGLSYRCALHETGAVSCWGNNYYGTLGDGTRDDSPIPVPVLGVTDAVDLVAGRYHACVVRDAGTVSCWGYNPYGQLGNGETEDYVTVPVDVEGLEGVVDIGLGTYHSCALLDDGSVSCWGNAGYGQFGDGASDHLEPVAIEGIEGANLLAVGDFHACAASAGGPLSCWGYNAYGELGDGGTTTSPSPVVVQGVEGVDLVTAGAYSTCAGAGGELTCWGLNHLGQLGNGTTATSVLTPTPIVGLAGVREAALGGGHGCARVDGGSLFCWGSNEQGQLGDGTRTSRLTPVPVAWP